VTTCHKRLGPNKLYPPQKRFVFRMKVVLLRFEITPLSSEHCPHPVRLSRSGVLTLCSRQKCWKASRNLHCQTNVNHSYLTSTRLSPKEKRTLGIRLKTMGRGVRLYNADKKNPHESTVVCVHEIKHLGRHTLSTPDEN